MAYSFKRDIEESKNEQLRHYVQELQQAYTKQNIHEALTALWKGLSIADLCDDEVAILELLDKAKKLSFYLAEDSSFQYMIESLIACSWNNKCIKVELFFLLSILHLQQRQFEQSYVAAKLGYYYVSKLQLDETDLTLCNAQLQLALTMLYTDKIVHIENLLNYFDWYVENCTTVGQQVVLQTVHVMIDITKNELDEAVLEELIEQLTNAKVSFYPLYLLMHLYYFCEKLNLTPYSRKLEAIFEERKKEYFHQLLTCEKVIAFKRRLHNEQFFNEMNKQFHKSILKQSNVTLVLMRGSVENVQKMYGHILQKDEEAFLLVKNINEHEYYMYISSREKVEIDFDSIEVLVQLFNDDSHDRFLTMYKDFLEQWEERDYLIK